MKHRLVYLTTLPFSLFGFATEIPVNAPFNSNWYTGVSLGQGHYNNGGNALANESERSTIAGTVYLGYQLNTYIIPELSYQYLGNGHAYYAQGDINGNFQQVVLAARIGYPLTASIYPYVKLGGAGWFGRSDGLRSGSEQGFSPVAAVGVEYEFTPRLSGRFEYQYTDSLGADSIGYTNHHLTTLGLSWRFGHLSPSVAQVQKTEPEVVELSPIIQTVEKHLFVYSELKGSSLFAHNSSVLGSTTQFKDVISFLLQHPSASAVITGHTDNTGREHYNQWLSERRAASVADHLISQGIQAPQLTTAGKGSAVPVADNATESGRAMNRRVEIIIPAFTSTNTAQ